MEYSDLSIQILINSLQDNDPIVRLEIAKQLLNKPNIREDHRDIIQAIVCDYAVPVIIQSQLHNMSRTELKIKCHEFEKKQTEIKDIYSKAILVASNKSLIVDFRSKQENYISNLDIIINNLSSQTSLLQDSNKLLTYNKELLKSVVEGIHGLNKSKAETLVIDNDYCFNKLVNISEQLDSYRSEIKRQIFEVSNSLKDKLAPQLKRLDNRSVSELLLPIWGSFIASTCISFCLILVLELIGYKYLSIYGLIIGWCFVLILTPTIAIPAINLFINTKNITIKTSNKYSDKMIVSELKSIENFENLLKYDWKSIKELKR